MVMTEPRGIKRPIKFGGSGGLITAEGAEKVGQNLQVIVLTQLGERVMEPEVGSASKNAVLRNPNSAQARAAMNYTISKLKSGEKRAIINAKEVVAEEIDIAEDGHGVIVTIPWIFKDDAVAYIEAFNI